MSKGKITQIIGAVVDVKFNEKLPEIFFQGKTLLDKTAEIKACYSFWEESE